jgi:phage shock protein A
VQTRELLQEISALREKLAETDKRARSLELEAHNSKVTIVRLEEQVKQLLDMKSGAA